MSKNTFELQSVDNSFHALLSCCPGNSENFAFLIRLMRRNVVIPFLGAGFSANFGYPVWGKFIRELAEKRNLPEVITALEANDFERAASDLKKVLGGSMEYILMQIFGDHVYKAANCSDEIEELPKIFRNLILTTNFDEVIEMLYAKVNGEYIEKLTPKSLKDVKVSYKRIACGEPTLIKLHGDVATREFVLTEQEYNEIYGERVLDIRLPLPSFLRDVLLSRIILFIGGSLEDDRTLRVIEQSQIDGSISFALLPLPADTANENDPWKPQLTTTVNGAEIEQPLFTKRKAFLDAHNIIPIWYPYGQHDALKIFLRAIACQVDSGHNLSVTVIRNNLNHLLADGDKMKKKGEISQAFYCFAQAEKMIKSYSEIFTDEDQLNGLGRVKAFYDANGYAVECMKIIKDIILLTERIYSHESPQLALCYHDLGYAYERYQYYKLMLKAMQQSQKVLREHVEKAGDSDAFYDAASIIYISLGYAYLKNNDMENAIRWYQEAEALYNDHGERLRKKRKAFVRNGLYRYYLLQGQTEAALQTLDFALKLRKELYEEERERILPQHLVNSHSNKIGIYLKENQVEEAETEYKACRQDCDIWDKPTEYPDAKCRILTDYGDILMAKGKKQEAYCEYQKALGYRKYLHFYDDLTAAGLYCKMADSLEDVPNHEEKALEYLIQAQVIYVKILGADSPKALNVLQHIDQAGEKLSYGKEALKQRLDVQREFMYFRYDEKVECREEELIRYFEL